MSDYGIKISLPNKNVKTADLKDLIFHSKYPMFKIKTILQGSFSITDGGAGVDQLLYTHNLGYNPLFFIWALIYDPFVPADITLYQKMPLTSASASGTIFMDYRPYANTTQIKFSADTGGGDGLAHTITYFGIVYYEPE